MKLKRIAVWLVTMAFYAENQDDRYGMQYSVEGGRWWTFSSGYRLNGF